MLMQLFPLEALAEFSAALGEPGEVSVPRGQVYRWQLSRDDLAGLSVYLILESPTEPHQPLVIVNDPSGYPDAGLKGFALQKTDDIAPVLEYIRTRMVR